MRLTVKTVDRKAGQQGFVVLPRLWVVERSLAWLTGYRRNVRDYERLPEHSAANLIWSAITIMTRRLTRNTSSAMPAL